MIDHQDDITFQIRDSIGIITLGNAPENYLREPGFIPLEKFLEWTGDDSLKGLIICGGGKNFSAGGDIGRIFSVAGEGDALEHLLEAGHKLLSAISQLDIPVVAAINRVCFGGGLEIALACHIRVASENALLAFPEVNISLMPGMGGTVRLPRQSGFAESARIILGGDMISASEAKSIGLVDYLAPKDQALNYASDLLKKMTQDRPVRVIRNIMKALKNATVADQEEAIREETRLFCELAREEAERRRKENGNR